MTMANRFLIMVVCGASVSLSAAAYKADMSSSGSATGGSVASALKPVETAMINGQYNRALMLLRNVEAQTTSVMMPVVAQDSPTASTPPPAPAPAPTPSPTPSPSPSPSPSPAPSSTPSPSSTSGAATPTDVTSPVLAYVPYPGGVQDSKTLFDRLKDEIDTRLVPPFNSIDDVWDSAPDACVVQYNAHLELCKNWVQHYQLLFARADWQPLGTYFYDKILKGSALSSSSALILNPIKVSVLGSGIHGTKYAAVYDHVCTVLNTLKLINVHQNDIQSLISLVSSAKTRSSIQGGLF